MLRSWFFFFSLCLKNKTKPKIWTLEERHLWKVRLFTRSECHPPLVLRSQRKVQVSFKTLALRGLRRDMDLTLSPEQIRIFVFPDVWNSSQRRRRSRSPVLHHRDAGERPRWTSPKGNNLGVDIKSLLGLLKINSIFKKIFTSFFSLTLQQLEDATLPLTQETGG